MLKHPASQFVLFLLIGGLYHIAFSNIFTESIFKNIRAHGNTGGLLDWNTFYSAVLYFFLISISTGITLYFLFFAITTANKKKEMHIEIIESEPEPPRPIDLIEPGNPLRKEVHPPDPITKKSNTSGKKKKA